MKKIVLFAIVLMALAGCVRVENATVVGTDSAGYANGQFRDMRSGKIANLEIYGGGGAGASAASAASLGALGLNVLSNGITNVALNGARGASSSDSSGGGGAMFGIRVLPTQSQGDPMPFAKSIATINYSKKLKNVKYDEFGGIYEYDFSDSPRAAMSKTPPPPDFGYKPVR
jgi:hypothetical protein